MCVNLERLTAAIKADLPEDLAERLTVVEASDMWATWVTVGLDFLVKMSAVVRVTRSMIGDRWSYKVDSIHSEIGNEHPTLTLQRLELFADELRNLTRITTKHVEIELWRHNHGAD